MQTTENSLKTIESTSNKFEYIEISEKIKDMKEDLLSKIDFGEGSKESQKYKNEFWELLSSESSLRFVHLPSKTKDAKSRLILVESVGKGLILEVTPPIDENTASHIKVSGDWQTEEKEHEVYLNQLSPKRSESIAVVSVWEDLKSMIKSERKGEVPVFDFNRSTIAPLLNSYNSQQTNPDNSSLSPDLSEGIEPNEFKKTLDKLSTKVPASIRLKLQSLTESSMNVFREKPVIKGQNFLFSTMNLGNLARLENIFERLGDIENFDTLPLFDSQKENLPDFDTLLEKVDVDPVVQKLLTPEERRTQK